MTIFDDNFDANFLTYFQLVTCAIWDTDYNTDNWEPGFMTIFATWQLIVTLDNICNSCDICTYQLWKQTIISISFPDDDIDNLATEIYVWWVHVYSKSKFVHSVSLYIHTSLLTFLLVCTNIQYTYNHAEMWVKFVHTNRLPEISGTLNVIPSKFGHC